MIYRDITYTDYNGETVTDRFYFNLSRAELLRLDIKSKDGLYKYMQRIVNSGDNAAIWSMFEEFVTLAVGKKSVDGRRFDKSDEAKKDFLESDAYSEFLYMLMSGNYGTDPNYAANFINGIIDEEAINKSLEKLKGSDLRLVKSTENA